MKSKSVAPQWLWFKCVACWCGYPSMVCVCVCVHVCARARAHVFVCARVCVCVCAYVHVCVQITNFQILSRIYFTTLNKLIEILGTLWQFKLPLASRNIMLETRTSLDSCPRCFLRVFFKIHFGGTDGLESPIQEGQRRYMAYSTSCTTCPPTTNHLCYTYHYENELLKIIVISILCINLKKFHRP